MKFKNLVKLSAPALALLLFAACSNGEEVVPEDAPVNQNIEEPMTEEETPADEGLELEEEDSNLEETEPGIEEDSESDLPGNSGLEEDSSTDESNELEEESDGIETEDPLNEESTDEETVE